MIWFLLGVVLTFCLFRYFDGCWLWEREDQIYGDDYGAQVPDADVTVFASGGGYAHDAPGTSAEIEIFAGGGGGGGGLNPGVDLVCTFDGSTQGRGGRSDQVAAGGGSADGR